MSIRASAASCDITPEAGVPLSGFPGTRRISTGIRDPLLASAIHLRGGRGGVVVLSLDLQYLEPAFTLELRRRISKAIGMREETIFIGTTQTHSGPVTHHALYLQQSASYAEPDPDYMELVAENAVRAASEAAVASCPVSVAVLPLENPGIGAIVIKANTGRILGAMVIARELPSQLGPANLEISSDLVHALRTRLTARFGGHPVIAYFPIPSPSALFTPPPEPGPEAATRTGEAIANELVRRVKTLTAQDFKSDLDFSGRFESTPEMSLLPFPEVAQTASWLAQAAMPMPPVETGAPDMPDDLRRQWNGVKSSRMLGIMLAFRKHLIDDILVQYQPVVLQQMAIGPVRLVGVPCHILPDAIEALQAGPSGTAWILPCINGNLQESLLTRTAGHAASFSLVSPLFECDTGALLAQSIQHLLAPGP